MNDNVLIQKILILAANPRDRARLRLDEETRDIKEGLRQAQERFNIESEWAVRPRDVRRNILNFKPDIVHFSGHGDEDGGLALENNIGQIQLVQPDAIAGLFKLFSDHVRCVFLNACYSETQANAIAQHIDFVIGIDKEIGDRAAIEFAVGFYDALGAGRSIEVAYDFGCNAIQMSGIKGNFNPILKCRESVSLQQIDIGSKILYEFVLHGEANEINRQKLETIVTYLREITGDTFLTLSKIERGSIKLVIEGSEEGFERLASLIASGSLKQVLDMPVKEVIRIEKIDFSKSDLSIRSQSLIPSLQDFNPRAYEDHSRVQPDLLSMFNIKTTDNKPINESIVYNESIAYFFQYSAVEIRPVIRRAVQAGYKAVVFIQDPERVPVSRQRQRIEVSLDSIRQIDSTGHIKVYKVGPPVTAKLVYVPDLFVALSYYVYLDAKAAPLSVNRLSDDFPIKNVLPDQYDVSGHDNPVILIRVNAEGWHYWAEFSMQLYERYLACSSLIHPV